MLDALRETWWIWLSAALLATAMVQTNRERHRRDCVKQWLQASSPADSALIVDGLGCPLPEDL